MKEALKLALEALDQLTNAADTFSVSGVYFNEEVWAKKCLSDAYFAITTIEEALAQQSNEQVEPVAWEPIETAPKDGSMVLICLPRQMNLVVRGRFNRIHNFWQTDYEGEGGITRPTYFHEGDLWHPIPPLYTHPPVPNAKLTAQPKEPAVAEQHKQEPVAHCEDGPEFYPVCHAETRSLALAAAIGYVQRNTPSLVSTEICKALSHIVDVNKMVEPPPWWPAVEKILNEYGLQAIDFVADFKKALAQPEQDDEVLGFNGWGFPIEKLNKALIEKTADHDVDCLCIDCAMVDEQDDVPWTDKAFERLCENWNNMTSEEFAIVQRFIFGVYAQSPQPEKTEQEPELGGHDVFFPIGITRPTAEEVSRKPKQEPAGMYRNKCADGSRCLHGCHTNEPCYTSPQPPQRKPLTDEQINEVLDSMKLLVPSRIARAIEAAHGIKE